MSRCKKSGSSHSFERERSILSAAMLSSAVGRRSSSCRRLCRTTIQCSLTYRSKSMRHMSTYQTMLGGGRRCKSFGTRRLDPRPRMQIGEYCLRAASGISSPATDNDLSTAPTSSSTKTYRIGDRIRLTGKAVVSDALPTEPIDSSHRNKQRIGAGKERPVSLAENNRDHYTKTTIYDREEAPQAVFSTTENKFNATNEKIYCEGQKTEADSSMKIVLEDVRDFKANAIAKDQLSTEQELSSVLSKTTALLTLKNGSWTQKERNLAKECLVTYSKNAPNVRAVKASLDLLERTVKEISLVLLEQDSEKPLAIKADFGETKEVERWLCNSENIFHLLNNWKRVAAVGRQKQRLCREEVLSPHEVVTRLQIMSATLSSCHHDDLIWNMILLVAIKRSSKGKAPQVAQELLNFMIAGLVGSGESAVRPSTFTYNPVLQAWATSGSEHAAEHMADIVDRMRAESLKPDLVTYNILLKFWAIRRSLAKTSLTLQQMRELDGLDPDISCLAHVVNFYTRSNKLTWAQEIIQDMIQQCEADNLFHTRAVGQAISHFVLRHATTVSAAIFMDDSVKNTCLQCRLLYTTAEPLLESTQLDRVRDALSQLHAASNVQSWACYFFERTCVKSTESYLAMVQLYGRLGKSDEDSMRKATALVQNMIKDKHVHSSVEVINSAIEGWANSSHNELREKQALILFNTMLCESQDRNDNPLKPTRRSYLNVLQSIANGLDWGIARRAEDFCQFMEHRFAGGDTQAKITDQTRFHFLEACFKCWDIERAEKVLAQLQSKPTVDLFNKLLRFYPTRANNAAAKKSKAILHWLKEKGIPEWQPDAISYNIVMRAFQQAGDHEGMWNIYQEMKEEGMPHGLSTYSTLIPALARTETQENLEKAEGLLNELLENNYHANGRLHYHPLIRGAFFGGDPQMANRVLQVLIDQYLKNQDCDPPISDNFHMVVEGWIRLGNLKRASSVLTSAHNMFDESMIPNCPERRTYTMLIDTWQEAKTLGSFYKNVDAHIQHLQLRMDTLPVDPPRPIRSSSDTFAHRMSMPRYGSTFNASARYRVRRPTRKLELTSNNRPHRRISRRT